MVLFYACTVALTFGRWDVYTNTQYKMADFEVNTVNIKYIWMFCKRYQKERKKTLDVPHRGWMAFQDNKCDRNWKQKADTKIRNYPVFAHSLRWHICSVFKNLQIQSQAVNGEIQRQ